MDADQRQPDQAGDMDEPQPSTDLIKGLEALYAKGPEIPSAVDERILSMARRQMGAPAASRAESSGVLARIGPRKLTIGGGVGALLAASVALAIWISLPTLQSKDHLAFEGDLVPGDEESLANADPDLSLRSSQNRGELRRERAQSPMAQSVAEPNAVPAPSRSLAERRDLGRQEADSADQLAKAGHDDAETEGAGVRGPALADRSDAPADLAEEAQPLDPADVDANGTLDILDAFALARAIENAQITNDLTWDLNHDGRVDNADVAHIALTIVSLDRPPANGGAS